MPTDRKEDGYIDIERLKYLYVKWEKYLGWEWYLSRQRSLGIERERQQRKIWIKDYVQRICKKRTESNELADKDEMH